MYRKVVITPEYLMDHLSNGIYSCRVSERADRTSEWLLNSHLLSMDWATDNISDEEYVVRSGQLRQDYDEVMLKKRLKRQTA